VIYAVVPIRSLDQGKSRLGAALSTPERAALVEMLLRRVLRALADSGAVERSAVVSPDVRALAVAEAVGAQALRQDGTGLNEALEQARVWALTGGADTLLVLLGDLPLLQGADIATMVEIAADPVWGAPVVVLAPDRHQRGTNALLLRPPGTLPFHFGADSYALHVGEAVAGQVELMIYRSPGTEFDLDTPGDLAELADLGIRD
jgi:2-phospho-L-lactate guanylyltransferase